MLFLCSLSPVLRVRAWCVCVCVCVCASVRVVRVLGGSLGLRVEGLGYRACGC